MFTECTYINIWVNVHKHILIFFLQTYMTQQNGGHGNVTIQLTEIVPVGMVVPNTGEWSLLVVTVT